jgi:NAD(P)-dependent dehydrogenase (short-subunit alcohol dehydrogenase family)
MIQMELQNRIAIVTGGGRGLGKAIALRLAHAGADVTVIGPHEDGLIKTAKEIEALGRRSLVIVTDVSKEEQVTVMAERTWQTFGHIDILVNNAGVAGPTALVVNTSRADWDEVMAVNLTGPFLCAKAVLPTMMARRSGKIINIASIAGKLAYALRSPYATSKWGLIGLTRTLAQEAGEYNIQVNAICPGPVAGERMQRVIQRRAQELGRSVEEVERMYVQTSALKRMVQADDVAALVVFLASDAGNNITGQAIDVAAGYAL